MRASALLATMALAACGTSAPPLSGAGPAAGNVRGGVEWTADDQLEHTWRLRSARGIALGVTFGREADSDRVHVGFGTGGPPPAGAVPLPEDCTVRVDLPGVAAGSEIGTTDESLGWHLMEHDVAVRHGDAVAVRPGCSRSIHLDTAAAFGRARLTPGRYRFDVIVAGEGLDERIPVEFAVAD